MTIKERNIKLKHFITCMKCEVSGKVCDDSCPVQYEAGNTGEIIENLEEISKILEPKAYEKFESTKDHIYKLAGDYKCWDNRLTQDEALELCHILEQQDNTWSLDDAREDFMHDVYNTLDFLPTNNEANKIIDSFDRVTKCIEQKSILDKVRAEIVEMRSKQNVGVLECLDIIDKYRAESEDKA